MIISHDKKASVFVSVSIHISIKAYKVMVFSYKSDESETVKCITADESGITDT